MIKKYLMGTMVMAISMTMLCACGKAEAKDAASEPQSVVQEVQEAEEVQETEEAQEAEEVQEVQEVQDTQEVQEWSEEDYPSNAFEERVGRTSFDSYDEIIGLLEGDEAYALVNIMGYEGQVLLVAEGTYDNLDGNYAAIEATPYTVKPNGKCTADSMFFTGGTANPIAIDDKGLVYCGTHHTMDKYCYGYNGTDIPAVMDMECIYIEEFDDNGDPKTVGGFIRTENTVIDNDGTQIEAGDVELLMKAFEDYEKASVVGFTLVK